MEILTDIEDECLDLPLYSTANMPRSAATKTDANFPQTMLPDLAQQVDKNLAEWFLEYKRPLKFRETTDPYKIMVSEFMLQQTTVAAVEPFYARFIDRFPTVHSLAAATEDEIMHLWAGLGYYRRARQLYASAKILVEAHGGRFPSAVVELQKLPGFGRYTAGAVASQAFNLPGAIVEANTVRVFARLAGITGIVGDSQFMKSVWNISEALVCRASSPRTFNQAAMELGAVICRPQPLCAECPVQQQCVAYRHGVADTIIKMRPRRENIAVEVVCIAIRDNERRYAVRRISQGEWHGGMWEFPANRIEGDVSSWISGDLSIEAFPDFASGIFQQFTTLRYQVTHHKITCHVYHCDAHKDLQKRLRQTLNVQFLSLNEISHLPMGSAQKKLLLLLTELNNLEKI